MVKSINNKWDTFLNSENFDYDFKHNFYLLMLFYTLNILIMY